MPIFREYDIRGLADKDITTEIVRLIGNAFRYYVKEKIVVGRDEEDLKKYD